MSDNENARAEGLRAWAEGMTTLVGAAELLIHYGPPLLTGPWVEYDERRDRYWFNTTAAAEAGGLSGGERRVLNIAASLADDEHPVQLGDAVSGLDHAHLELVLAAIEAAAGGHETERVTIVPGEGDEPARMERHRNVPRNPWPEQS